MKVGKIITELRKEKGVSADSQADLAAKADISQVMIGKYERGDAIPSIEVAKKIADAFYVSLDALVGEGNNVHFVDLKRLQEIKQLDKSTKDKMWFFIDTILRDFKAKQVYS